MTLRSRDRLDRYEERCRCQCADCQRERAAIRQRLTMETAAEREARIARAMEGRVRANVKVPF